MRLFGAFGVVLFHSDSTLREFGGFGLIVFLTLSTIWAVRSRDTVWQAMQKSAPTILLPWLIWFVIFGLFNLAERKAFLAAPDGWVLAILRGTSVHLWYLPYLAFCIMIMYLLRRSCSRVGVIVLLGLSLGFIAFIQQILAVAADLPEPLAQYCVSFGAILLGLVLASGMNARLVAGLSILAAVIPILGGMGPLAVAYPFALSLIAVALARRDMFEGWNVQAISRTSFGIYAMHPIVLYHIAPRLHLDGFAAAVLAFFLSMAVVMVTAKIMPPVARVLFLVR